MSVQGELLHSRGDLVRTGLRLILDTETDIEVVAKAWNGRKAVETATALEPDVVLPDIRMPEMGGLEATRLLLGGGSTSRVVILTTFDLDQYVYDALLAGASGCRALYGEGDAGAILQSADEPVDVADFAEFPQRRVECAVMQILAVAPEIAEGSLRAI